MVPDGRRLRAFDKIELQPGETKTVTFDLKADDLAFVGYDGKWVLEEGDFKLMIADQSADIHCEKTYQWQSVISLIQSCLRTTSTWMSRGCG